MDLFILFNKFLLNISFRKAIYKLVWTCHQSAPWTRIAVQGMPRAGCKSWYPKNSPSGRENPASLGPERRHSFFFVSSHSPLTPSPPHLYSSVNVSLILFLTSPSKPWVSAYKELLFIEVPHRPRLLPHSLHPSQIPKKNKKREGDRNYERTT